jgi:hypothetical protein
MHQILEKKKELHNAKFFFTISLHVPTETGEDFGFENAESSRIFAYIQAHH